MQKSVCTAGVEIACRTRRSGTALGTGALTANDSHADAVHGTQSMWRSSRLVPAGDGETGTGESDLARQQQAGREATGRQQHFRTWLALTPDSRGPAAQGPVDAPPPSKTLSRASIFVHRLGAVRLCRIVVPKARSYRNRWL